MFHYYFLFNNVGVWLGQFLILKNLIHETEVN